jgi:cell division protein FtsB
MAASAAAQVRRRASANLRGGPGIRWDRLARIGLLAMLGGIMLLYISPAKHWLAQSNTAKNQSADLHALQAEQQRLTRKVHALQNPDTLEMEARRLGMVKVGERSFVLENPPKGK